jgi:predicted TIM-barrel fold metal-dependent hydrolase
MHEQGETFAQCPIVDCHVHFGGADLDAIDGMLAAERAAGVEAVSLLAGSFPRWVNSNPEGFYAKARHPDRVYLFAALDYSAIIQEVDHRWTHSLASQLDRLLTMGCDGIKMVNGKPDSRKASGLALDSVIYEDHFARLEERGLPLLWHVADPEEFWSPDEAPEWARSQGWLYDQTFPSKESLHQECERVLARYPKLKVIFAHFYFLSADLSRAAALLDRFPNVYLDLAPGIEMLHNFTARPDESREFFIRYRDRILFGTDYAPDSTPSRIWVVRRFLETDAEFPVPQDDPLFWPDHRVLIRSIALDEDTLDRIYSANFRRVVSPVPRPLDQQLVIQELGRLAVLQDALGAPRNTARQVAHRLSGARDADQSWAAPFEGLSL